MKVSVDIDIAQSSNTVWTAITDIEHYSDVITSIIDLEILNQPESSLIGLKWKETRKMFGKEATETMWITDAAENQYYCTRAENHGAVYITRLSLTESEEATTLTMTFSAEAATIGLKIISAIMSVFVKKMMKNALQTDLEDIKKYVEGRSEKLV